MSDHPRGRFVDAATFGAFLRNRRESQNLSLRDVAAETKIAGRYLAALENGDVRSWPGGIYRRGMVRAYATAVGLDPASTVSEFADAFNEAPAQTVELEPSPAPPAFDDLIRVRPHATLFVGLALCGAIAVFTWGVPSSNAAGGIATNQTEPVAAAGDRDDAATATVTSGPPSAPGAPVQALPELTTVALPPSASTPLSSTPTPSPSTATPPPSTATSPPSPPTPPPSIPMPPGSTPADEPPAPAPADGSMQITSEPAGANVTVNGIQWGQTPVTIRYLEPGEKHVRLTKDGYASAERRLVLTPDQPTQEVMVSLAIEQ